MPSSAENDERVMTLAAAALRMPAAEREEFLKTTCKDQPDLYREIAEVVRWEERMGDFLRQPLIELIDLDPLPKPFQPGQEIAGRFVIMSEAGEGGMGVVYEAFDRKRNQRIAIKCGKAGFGRLLSPELEGALRVRHPNICLVNEIHTARTGSGEVDFLTMEFLDGEMLSRRLARQGKLGSDEALEIARQLCAGLAAAHRAGILHRDLKTGNVSLVKDDEGGTRAVITDFGLAAQARLESGVDGGTPRYMAPELWHKDGKPSKASDVYALGVVLYEMVTGQAPFDDGPGGQKDAAPKLPSALNKELDAHWDKAILPCLETLPAARPQAQDVLAAFDQRPLWRSPKLAVAVLVLIALLAAFQQPIMKLFTPPDIRLAILPLDAPAGLQEMGNGVLQDVTERLMRSRESRRTVIVIPASEAAQNNVKSPQEAARVLHATHSVQVKLRREGEWVIAEEALVELAYSTHVRNFTGSYQAVSLGDMPQALAGALTSALHLRRSAPSEVVSTLATPAYDQGLFFLQDGKSLNKAISSFEEAAQQDPHSPLPLASLSEAQLMKSWAAKDDKEWVEAARRSLEKAEAINPDSVAVLLAKGRLEANTGQLEKALDSYRRVTELEPRNVEVWLRMAGIHSHSSRIQALADYQKAIALQPDYYKGYQELGIFFYFQGEYSEAAEQFRQAIAHAPGLHEYEPYFYLGAAETDLGHYEQGEQAFLTALKIKETPEALCGLGAVKSYQQHYSEAAGLFQRSLQLNGNSYICLLNLGDVDRWLHRSSEAVPLYQRAWAQALSGLEQNPQSGYIRAFVAYLAGRLHDRKRSEEEIAQALALSPEDNKVIRRAVLTYEMLGKRDKAMELAARLSPRALLELQRHPDLAEFCQDDRYKKLIATGGR